MVQVLRRLPGFDHPWVSSETGPVDDAAVVRPQGAAESLVLTTDVITPIVDDPETFGRIAAVNALSDVYAMGGAPQVALALVGMPEELPLEMLSAVLRGCGDAVREAGAAIVGGHTMRDTEPKCGLFVLGSVATDALWSQRAARPGDLLVLTKALGTGAIAQAMRDDAAAAEHAREAVASMSRSNARACELGREHGVHAATDVTGFGLLGHLWHLLQASGLAARVRGGDVPALPGAETAIEAGHLPGGSKRNWDYVRDHVRGEEAVSATRLALLCDAQTSGGLLLCADPRRAPELVERLRVDHRAAIVGQLLAGEPGIALE